MSPKEFASIIAKTTGKLVNIGRVGRLFKLYSPSAIEQGLMKLREHEAPHMIPDPVTYIQRILAVDANKEDTKELLDQLTFGKKHD